MELLERAAQKYRDQTAYPHPICRVVVDGRDITGMVTARLVSINLTDNRGMEADQLDIQLSDHDGLLAIPPTGAKIALWLGWSDTGLVSKGTYTVDETEHSGAPDVLNIRARSADLREGLKVKREKSWHLTTIGAVVQSIAGAYGLSAAVSAVLSAVQLAHLDQTGESDLNLLTRLAGDNDAIASIKAGRLLFMPTGAASSASGLSLPHVTLTRADGDQHRYLNADRNSYTGVVANYYEDNSAKRLEAVAGTDENAKTLRQTFASQASALTAARAEWKRLQRGEQTLSYTLAKGRPDLIPELTYSLVGVKAEISAIVWLGGNVQHSFTPESYTTVLDLTAQLPHTDDLVSDAVTAEQYTGVVAWYREEKTGKQIQMTKGDQSKPRRLKHLYASKASAKRAVEREMNRLNTSN